MTLARIGTTLPAVLMGAVSTPAAKQASWVPVRADVARDRRISTIGKAIYALLVQRGAGDTAHQKGQRNIAATVGCHVNTVGRQLALLVKYGYLVAEHQYVTTTEGLVRRVTDALALVGMRGVRHRRGHPKPPVSDSSQSTTDGGTKFVEVEQVDLITDEQAAQARAEVRARLKPSPRWRRWG